MYRWSIIRKKYMYHIVLVNENLIMELPLKDTFSMDMANLVKKYRLGEAVTIAR